MNYRRVLLILCIASCLFLWRKRSKEYCTLRLPDNTIWTAKDFSRDEWHKYPLEGNSIEYKNFYLSINNNLYVGDSILGKTRTNRELMICDLTQNVIPLGTPYEDVLALLGKGLRTRDLPVGLVDKKYSYLYEDEILSKLVDEKGVLDYIVGSSPSGDNGFYILFEKGRVSDFFRVQAQ